MNANDSGLSIYQMRLMTCAEIVRHGTGPFSMKDWSTKVDCGTAYCAVGEYCMAGVSDLKLFAVVHDRNRLFPGYAGPEDEAVMNEFGITWDEQDRLFMPMSYEGNPTRAYVADRIQHFALHEHADVKVKVKV